MIGSSVNIRTELSIAVCVRYGLFIMQHLFSTVEYAKASRKTTVGNGPILLGQVRLQTMFRTPVLPRCTEVPALWLIWPAQNDAKNLRK